MISEVYTCVEGINLTMCAFQRTRISEKCVSNTVRFIRNDVYGNNAH